MTAKKSPCWPGYEPVPGKEKGAEGSCRMKAASKSTPDEKKFQAKRTKQLDVWQKDHPGSPRSAAQHLSAPTHAKNTPAKKKKQATGRSK